MFSITLPPSVTAILTTLDISPTEAYNIIHDTSLNTAKYLPGVSDEELAHITAAVSAQKSLKNKVLIGVIGLLLAAIGVSLDVIDRVTHLFTPAIVQQSVPPTNAAIDALVSDKP